MHAGPTLASLPDSADPGSGGRQQLTDDGRAIVAALMDPLASTVVVGPPAATPGSWAGAPSALLVDGALWLAYRLRRPMGHGRGYANVVARSDDGERFETVAVIHRETFGAASLERPMLTRSETGRWRLYVSCAKPGTYGWRVDLLEADSVESLATAAPAPMLPGSTRWAVKDPLVLRVDDGWHLWASCHPLDDLANTDRMISSHATSADGLAWRWRGTALRGRRAAWDGRGARITTVLSNGRAAVAFYDGRATAEENWEERTGVAVSRTGLQHSFTPVGDGPVAQSPHAGGGLRYLSVVVLPDGGYRLYFELTRPDGAHELRTRLAPAP